MVRIVLLGIVLILVMAACGQTEDDDNNADAANQYDDLFAFVEDPPQPVDDFTMSSTTGTPFTLSDQNRLTLMYFGFTSCPDVCPTTLYELRQAYVELGEPADKLNIVFVTVDPERDTPENITQYLGLYHPDFIGLYGEDEELAALRDAFDVVAVREEMEDSALGYNINHTASLFVISPQGELIATFAHGTTAFTVAHDMRIWFETEF